jgi:hypothetical protein
MSRERDVWMARIPPLLALGAATDGAKGSTSFRQSKRCSGSRDDLTVRSDDFVGTALNLSTEFCVFDAFR